MPGCYGNRKFRGNHVFYCRYFLGGIVYRRDISFTEIYLFSSLEITDSIDITDSGF